MTEISEAAKAKAEDLLGEWLAAGVSLDIRNRFARFIQEVSDAAKVAVEVGCIAAERRTLLDPFILPEPVDPLLIEAREIAARNSEEIQYPAAADIRAGKYDEHPRYGVSMALAALKRGIELGKAQS